MEVATQFLMVVIVGEDTDLLVLLTSLAPTYINNFLMKPGKGNTFNVFFFPRHLKCSNKIHPSSSRDSSLRRIPNCRKRPNVSKNPMLLEVYFPWRRLLIQ